MVHIETMPAEDVTFKIDRATRPLKTMYYYVEALPSDTNTVTRNGVRYTLKNTIKARYNGVTEEDFIELEGFTKKEAADSVNGQSLTPRSFDGLTGLFYIASTTQDQSIYFFYTRDKYKIVYNDGRYVDGNGSEIATETIRKDIHESEDIYYQANLADQKDEFIPSVEGYTFGGWYLDDACTHPFDFESSTMPKGGIQLYAKWVQNQYRVFLHPNVPTSDTTLEWGQTNQQTSFRVDYGEKVSGGNKIIGTRDEYEIIGWYTDPECTNVFNFDAYTLRDDTKDINGNDLLSTYTKVENTELDKYGNPTESGNKDAAANRFWINKKLDLYAKWRAIIVGAPGINVEYDAVLDKGIFPDGSVTYTDPLTYYLDRAEATAAAASNALDNDEQFLHWVLQKWNGTAYEDVKDENDEDVIVYPGDTFEVLKAYAKEEEYTGPDASSAHNKKYTVRLRAEYGEKQAPRPTHIYWYANNDSEPGSSPATNTEYMVKTMDGNSEYLEINKEFPIMPANTFTYEGHTFLGWARVNEPEDVEVGDVVREDKPNLNEADLYLKYDSKTNTFQAYIKDNNGTWAWTDVTEVAADEKQPYHDMYAVWEKKKYSVTVIKEVESPLDGDQNISFSFTPTFPAGLGTDVQTVFTLSGNANTKTFNDGTADALTKFVPYETKFKINESAMTGFEITSVTGEYTDDSGNKHEIKNLANNSEIEVLGDTVIKYKNTRQTANVTIKKELVNPYINTEEGVDFNFSASWDNGGQATATVNSKNADGVKIKNVPVGATMVITETADSEFAYTVEASGKNTTDTDTVANTYTFTVPEEDEVVTFTNTVVTATGINVRKTDDQTPATGLKDAQFTLTRNKKLDGSSSTFAAITGEFSGTIISDDNGMVIKADKTLPTGVYKLTETKAPSGYIITNNKVVFSVQKDGTGNATITLSGSYENASVSEDGKTLTITNKTGKELPMTGGSGTLPYTLGGIALVGAAALMYGFRMRRRERRSR